MKALVISGGGCKGSWGGGLAQALYENGNDYGILVGTSTGSMLIPLIAIKDFARLKEAYTSVTQKSIFKVNPFKVNSPNMELDLISITDNLVLRGQKTFGDSSPILGVIKSFFTGTDWMEIVASGKRVVACVSNLTKSQVEYYDIQDCKYEDFCEWIQASGSFAPFMSLIEKNGCSYADGGAFDPLPIQKAIDMGADEVHVIVLDPKKSPNTNTPITNVFGVIAAMTGCMSNQLLDDDVEIGNLLSCTKDVKLNIYFTDTVLTNNSLEFNKAQMLEWWNMGYQKGKNETAQISLTIKQNC